MMRQDDEAVGAINMQDYFARRLAITRSEWLKIEKNGVSEQARKIKHGNRAYTIHDSSINIIS